MQDLVNGARMRFFPFEKSESFLKFDKKKNKNVTVE